MSSVYEDSICYTPFKKYDSILNDKSENFEKKVTSLIEVWNSIAELNSSQFDIRYVIQIIDWAKLHALNIVLTGEWRSTKESFRNTLLESIEKAQSSLATVNDAFSSRCQKLADVVKKPWEDPVLANLIQEKDVEIGSKEIEFFCVETAYLVSVRLKKLCENHCEDLALNLVTNFLNYKKIAAAQNFNLNATETQLWFIFDIYIALLFKFQDKTRIIQQFEELQLEEGVSLIKRFAKKRVKISKIWRNCQKIAIFGSRFFMSKALMKYTDEYKDFVSELLKTYLGLSNTDTLLQEFVLSVRNITNLADAAGLCIMCEVIHREAADKLRVFAIEMYIRALTTDMNELERLKHVNEEDKVKSTTSRLANTFTNLADLLDDHVKVARECVLTAFSLEPTKERLKRIEELAKRSGFPVLDTGQEWKCRLHPPVLPSDDLAWVCPECGEWMCKPELTAPLQMNMALHEALQESVLGISEALCDDLVVCLSNPRYQILSWLLAWGDLYRLCILYLNDPEKTKNFVTELKFVDVDYSMFEHIKREPVDEFTGIEKGYEQYLDLDFVSDEETSSVSEDSMSHERSVGLGSDGAGEPYLTLPQPKSDPVTLKSLRMFRPNLKRKKDDSDSSSTEKKAATQVNSNSSASSVGSSLQSYLLNPHYHPQSEYLTNIAANNRSTQNLVHITPSSSVYLPQAAGVTKQKTTSNISQISAASNFSSLEYLSTYAAKQLEVSNQSANHSRSNFDQLNSRIQTSFNSNANPICYSAKLPEQKRNINVSLSSNLDLQPENSIFSTTNLISATSTSYVSNIIKSTLSYGVPKVTVTNSTNSSTVPSETITNSHSFGSGSLNVTKHGLFNIPKQTSFSTSNHTSQKNITRPNSFATPSTSNLLLQKNPTQQGTFVSHPLTLQKNSSHAINSTVPDLDALLNEIDTNRFETDSKNGVAATLLQLGGQVAKKQKQPIQVSQQLNLNQTPTKLPQGTSSPNGTKEDCKTKLKNSIKSDKPNHLGVISDQVMEPPCKARKLTLENNQDQINSLGRTTFKIMELEVQIPKLNLENYTKKDKLNPAGIILDKVEQTPQTPKVLPIIQDSSPVSPSKYKIPSVPPKHQCPPETCLPPEIKPSMPVTQCRPQLSSKPEPLTLLRDKSPSQTEVPVVQVPHKIKTILEPESPISTCQKEQSSMPQEVLRQETTIRSEAQPLLSERQLKVVLNKESCQTPQRLESVIIIPPVKAKKIISQALLQQHPDSKSSLKEPVSELPSASINLVKSQNFLETTNISHSLPKTGINKPLKPFNQYTDKKPVNQIKSPPTCTLADSLKIITPITMDCDKDKKVQTNNEKTDVEMTELEENVTFSTAEDNNNHCISQVSLRKTDEQVSLIKDRHSKYIKENPISHEPNSKKPIYEKWEVSSTQNNNDSIMTDSDLASDKSRIDQTNTEKFGGNPGKTQCNSNKDNDITSTEKNTDKTLNENEHVNDGKMIEIVNKNLDCDKKKLNIVQINTEPRKLTENETKQTVKEELQEAEKRDTKEAKAVDDKSRQKNCTRMEMETEIVNILGDKQENIIKSKQRDENMETTSMNSFENIKADEKYGRIPDSNLYKVALEKNDTELKNTLRISSYQKEDILTTKDLKEVTVDTMDNEFQNSGDVIVDEDIQDNNKTAPIATVAPVKENILQSIRNKELVKTKTEEIKKKKHQTHHLKEQTKIKMETKDPYNYIKHWHDYCQDRTKTSRILIHLVRPDTPPETSPESNECYKKSIENTNTSKHSMKYEISPNRSEAIKEGYRKSINPNGLRHVAKRESIPRRSRLSNECYKKSLEYTNTSKHLMARESSPKRSEPNNEYYKKSIENTNTSKYLAKRENSSKRSQPSNECYKKSIKNTNTSKHLTARESSPKRSEPSNGCYKKSIENTNTSKHSAKRESSKRSQPSNEGYKKPIENTNTSKHLMARENSPKRSEPSNEYYKKSIENTNTSKHSVKRGSSSKISQPSNEYYKKSIDNTNTSKYVAKRESSKRSQPSNLCYKKSIENTTDTSKYLEKHERYSRILIHLERPDTPPEISQESNERYKKSIENTNTSKHSTRRESSPDRFEATRGYYRKSINTNGSRHVAKRESIPRRSRPSNECYKKSLENTNTSKHLMARESSPKRSQPTSNVCYKKSIENTNTSKHLAKHGSAPKRSEPSSVCHKKSIENTNTSKHFTKRESSPMRSQPTSNVCYKKPIENKSSVLPSKPRPSMIAIIEPDMSKYKDDYLLFTDSNGETYADLNKENIKVMSEDVITIYSRRDLDSMDETASKELQAKMQDTNFDLSRPETDKWNRFNEIAINTIQHKNQNIKKYSNTHKRKHENVPCFKVDQEKNTRKSNKSITDDFEAKELSVVLQRLPNRIPTRVQKSCTIDSITLLQQQLREKIKENADVPICVLYRKDTQTSPLQNVNIGNQGIKKREKRLDKKLKSDYINAINNGGIPKKKARYPQRGILKKISAFSSKPTRTRIKKQVHFNLKPQVFYFESKKDRSPSPSSRSALKNVPGLSDYSEVIPRHTEQVVNVVQVSGSRSSTATNQNTQTSTQVTPHIQRIGQPKLAEQKSDRSEEKSEPSTSSSTTTSKPSTSQSQQKPGQKSSGTSRQTPYINVLSQHILKQPGSHHRSPVTYTRPSSFHKKNEPSTSCSTDQTATVIKVEPEDDVEVETTNSINTNVKIVTSTTPACGAAATTTSSAQGGTILQLICKSSSLPKFQQAFGKTVYQANSSNDGASESAGSSTTENSNQAQTATVLETKKIATKAVPVNVQPITGNVIFRGQVPVGQTVSLIPPGSNTRQLFRITGSTHEQISLVKETVIQNKMSALLAAALQGKPKITEQNGELVEEYSATRITLCRPGTVPPNATRIVKPVQLQIPANAIRAPPPNLSSTTLEQLREFDMVYKQVKERSNNPAQPETAAQGSQESPQQQRISFTYVNQVQKYTQLSPVMVVSSYSPFQHTVSPTLSVTSQSGSGACLTQVSTIAVPKVAVKTSKGKNVKSTATKTPFATVPIIPKPQQKTQEDEYTTQRIFDILAEYAEQLRNSPDLNNKPAPRRRSNPPTNPSSSTSGSCSNKKKKKKSSNSTTSNLVETDNEDLTMGSEDSSGGNIVQLSMTDEEQSQSASITPPETNLEPATSNTPTPRPLIVTDASTHPRNVIIADSSVGEALKMPNTALIMPGSYIMPVSVVKGGQQIAVVSGGSKILTTVPARSGQNMLLFQSFVNQNKKGGISAVKYSTLQPFSGISSQNVAGVSAQPPVVLPSNSLATVALGQPITLKKLEDNERVTNTELLLAISHPREQIKVEPLSDFPQPDSSTCLLNDTIKVKIEEGDSSSSEVFNNIQKTNSVATSVIASLVKKEKEEQCEDSSTIDTSIVKVEEPSKQEERIGSILVNSSTSNGPMLSHTNSRYRKPSENVESTTAPTKELNHNTSKAPTTGTKTFKNNAVYYAIRTKKAVTKKIDSEMQKQVAMERELRLQKSLSEECEDLGVDEPSTSDLFPEADLLFDSNHSPSYDQSGQRIQVAEVKAKASMNLFSDDEDDDENSCPMSDDLFDYVEYHPSEDVEQQINGNTSNESASSCDDTTLLPNCGTMSEVTLNSPISPEYTDSSHAINKYKYKYTNRKKGEKANKSQTDNWSEVTEVTSTEDSIEITKEEDTPIAVQEETVIDEPVAQFEMVVVDEISPERELTSTPKCPIHGSMEYRVSRRNIRKICSCFNGSKSPTVSTVKRRLSSPPKSQNSTSNKKSLLSKKR